MKGFENIELRLLLKSNVKIISEFWGIPKIRMDAQMPDLSLHVSLHIFLPTFRTLGVPRKDIQKGIFYSKGFQHHHLPLSSKIILVGL